MKAKNKGVKITLATDLMIAYPDDACSKETNVSIHLTVSIDINYNTIIKSIKCQDFFCYCTLYIRDSAQFLLEYPMGGWQRTLGMRLFPLSVMS